VRAGQERAIAVVGAGIKAPGGAGMTEIWPRVLAGRPAVAPYEDPMLPDGVSLLAARASDFRPADYVTGAELRRLDRVHLLAIGAADDALRNVGSRPAPDRCAVVCGQGYGAAAYLDEGYGRIAEHGMRGLSPLAVPLMMHNSAAAHLAIRHGFEGPCHAVASACASGTDAIGQAAGLLRSGAADLVLAGGVEAVLALWTVLSFYRTGALSAQTDPELAPRPFDRDRDGFVLGEGAGFVVLQRLADARDQGRDILGLVCGYAANCDAYHIVAPREDGRVAQRCAELAVADAGIAPADVGHVNAHGTGTARNDLAEARAMTGLFGGAPPAVTAVKGVTGHMIGGSGAVEAIITLLTLQAGLIPPTAGYQTPDPDIGLDIVAGHPRPTDAQYAISNSFGFGGHNAVLVLGRA
jgi:3-oxoacyl-[acyl-carrier-protein] synthase II